ncbi:hypothetical protein ABT095_38420 [Kitasatospora sp. NPDC002227]|uniref:hypothetical protein n=1 Tax=Kitasatospora sp. NPDC002227 TaxID=3154773 RepID=UPI003318398E
MKADASVWKVPEQSVIPRNAKAGEDVLVLTEDSAGEIGLAAVTDGATDKSGRDYGGMSGGALAAATVAEVLSGLGPAAGAGRRCAPCARR